MGWCIPSHQIVTSYESLIGSTISVLLTHCCFLSHPLSLLWVNKKAWKSPQIWVKITFTYFLCEKKWFADHNFHLNSRWWSALTGETVFTPKSSENHSQHSKPLRLGMKNAFFSIIYLSISNLIQVLQFLKWLATLMEFQIRPKMVMSICNNDQKHELAMIFFLPSHQRG